MMIFVLGLAIGYFARKYANFEMLDDGGTLNAEIGFGLLVKDFIWFLKILGAAAVWAVNVGRSTRNYFDAALIPWLNSFGISVKLPTIALPAMPAQLAR